MNSGVFAASCVLAVSVALAFNPASARKQRLRDADWVLTVRHDRFTNQTRCTLASTNHQLRYQPGAVGFQLGTHDDTLTAWYRVDGGAPIRWQDRTASLIATGVEIDGPALDNPTGGWVWIPIAEVEDAKIVVLRANDRARIHQFRLAGFAPMLVSARHLDCGFDDVFQS